MMSSEECGRKALRRQSLGARVYDILEIMENIIDRIEVDFVRMLGRMNDV